MAERTSGTREPMPWRVPVAVEDVTETGESFALVADADTRAAVARVTGLRDLPRFEANFEVTRYGAGGLRVVGEVSASVGQTCVVTLEPLASIVTEEIDLRFVPRPAAPHDGETAATPEANDDKTEVLVGGSIDLGALATEFLTLGLDPYPRKPGAVFQPPQDATREPGPFAALAALKKDSNDR
jgi:uncharacterized metal-binding protein YceD (DUF177 family)